MPRVTSPKLTQKDKLCETHDADGEIVVDDVAGDGVSLLLLARLRRRELDLPPIHHDHRRPLDLVQQLRQTLAFVA